LKIRFRERKALRDTRPYQKWKTFNLCIFLSLFPLDKGCYFLAKKVHCYPLENNTSLAFKMSFFEKINKRERDQATNNGIAKNKE
jgi:hypothetical protein